MEKISIFWDMKSYGGIHGDMVESLCYKLEGHGLDSQWDH